VGCVVLCGVLCVVCCVLCVVWCGVRVRVGQHAASAD